MHGVSPRRIFFRAQAPAREPLATRRALELYHRHAQRLPAGVRRALRAVKARLGPGAPEPTELSPRLQYALPATPGPFDVPRR